MCQTFFKMQGLQKEKNNVPVLVEFMFQWEKQTSKRIKKMNWASDSALEQFTGMDARGWSARLSLGWSGKSFRRQHWSKDLSVASCANAGKQNPAARGTSRGEMRAARPPNGKSNVDGRVQSTGESGRKQQQRNRQGRIWGGPCVSKERFRVYAKWNEKQCVLSRKMTWSEMHFKSHWAVCQTDYVSKNGSWVTSQGERSMVQVWEVVEMVRMYFSKNVFLGQSTCCWIGWESARKGSKNDSWIWAWENGLMTVRLI